MKKIVCLKVLISIIIMISVVTATILLLLPRREIYNYLYEQQQLEQQTGVSSFEAELNYDGMIQQIMGNQKIMGLSTYDSSGELKEFILWVQQIYQGCKWVCGVGILLSVLGLIILRNQKWYDVLCLGGIITISISIVSALIFFLVKPLRLFFLESQYDVLIKNDPILLNLLPKDWGFFTCIAGLACILIAGILLLLLHIGSRRSYKPHKF